VHLVHTYRFGVCDELKEEVSTDSVNGGDDDVGEAHAGIYHEGWLPFHPAHPLDLVRM